MNFIELCAGLGGTRAGLEAAGWNCLFAVDFDPDVIQAHDQALGSIELLDVANLNYSTIPDCEVWVAGFPCQPFSSSGNREGFLHRSGNVFESIMRLVSKRRPPVIIFENVVGLLSNKSGHTFSSVLALLMSLDYEVDWMVIDASWLGVPQSRPRVFMVASTGSVLKKSSIVQLQKPLFEGHDVESVFAPLINDLGLELKFHKSGDIYDTQQRLAQGIGEPRPPERGDFTNFGRAKGGKFWSYRTRAKKVKTFEGELAKIVAPNFIFPEEIRSARFWSEKGGGGKNGIHLRDVPIAHCVGTTLGGAPLFAVPQRKLKSFRQKKEFLSHSDWHREQQDILVMRLKPSRSVRLFGKHTDKLENAIDTLQVGATRKFKLVGNMVAPQVALSVAKCVSVAWNGN